jgi:hypothetical protein
VEAFYRLLQAESEETREVADDSAEKLEERLAAVRRLLAQGRDFVRAAEQEVEQVAAALAAVRGISHEGPVFELKGRRLADRSVELLADSGKEQPIHYTDWYRLLEDAGEVVTAKDPMATFLTALTRDDRIERVGHRTGMYRLKGEA